MCLVTARTGGLTTLTGLAWGGASFTSLCVVDAVVSIWTLIHASIAQEIHAKVALKTLVTRLITFKAACVTLGADAIDFIVVAGAVISARPIKVKWK